MKKVLILGIGNRLMMDDGIGVHVVEELCKRNSNPDVYCVAGETDVGFCLRQIGEASSVIIIDAAYFGKEPGAIYTIPIQQTLQCSPKSISFHKFDLFKELQIDGKSVKGMLIGIEPYKINYGMKLSDVLQNKFQDIVDKVERKVQCEAAES